MRLTKQEFVDAMKQLQQASELLNTVGGTIGLIPESPLYNIVNEYFNLLHKLCDIPDEYYDDALSYYVYELDFGKQLDPIAKTRYIVLLAVITIGVSACATRNHSIK